MTSALFQRLFDLEKAIEIRQVHKSFIKLPITLLIDTTCSKDFEQKIYFYREGSSIFRLNFVPSFSEQQNII